MNTSHWAAGLCLAAAALSLAHAQPQAPQRPNEPVFRSGPWFVVRSVRDGGNVVACTGFYRGNRGVQLSRDVLAIKTQQDIRGVSIGFDDKPMGKERPLTSAEQQLGALAISGEDFARLARSKRLRVAVTTAQGTSQHALELRGLAGALENIQAGCPVPAEPLRRPMREPRA